MSGLWKQLRFASVTLAIIAASGCDYYKDKASPIALGQLSYVPGYVTVRAQVFQGACFQCHTSGQKAPDLTTYATAFAAAQMIRDATVSEKKMPKNGSLTPFQLQLIAGWVDGGAPEQDVKTPLPSPSASPSPGPMRTTPAQAITQINKEFETSIKPLVQRACMDCHDSNAVPEGILGHLPIARAIEWDHIHKASAVLDFSLPFPAWSSQENDPVFFLTEIKTVIENGSMPIPEFKIFHQTDGKLLTYGEEETVVAWADRSLALWAEANPLPPTPSQFITSRCLGCHNATTSYGGLVFDKNGDQVKFPSGRTDTGIPFVTPGDPANSAVYLVLLTDPAQRKGLAQMPKDGSATDVEQALILDWIKQAR